MLDSAWLEMMWEEWLEMILKETYNSVMWNLITKA